MRRFLVTFVKHEYYELAVEAEDHDAAADQAWDMFVLGKSEAYHVSSELDHVCTDELYD